MNENEKPQDDAAPDEAVKAELKGVPEEFLDCSADGEDDGEAPDAVAEALENLRNDLEKSKQDVLYAQAETQNVRRRAEKDIQDARNYAATGFARDILSVWDNLSRAVESIPDSLRDDDKMKGLVTGIEATQRELEKVFQHNGITRVAAMGLPLDPNQHQAMMEIPSNEHEAGTIVQEMQAGWMIKDRLLRPAMVGVSKKPD
ncbi:nucleotide exchange factor GrpE [uncultured Erythrobacter sp.]|uniref:nucleotide exchange factor GrpE n=1 Tax=uncultured Erythrobacter sp. TaxID=263913 RepID=UPI0026267317|nr:nucleotide exchange factor GrpE [uncultured Erythrobacter sp.]